MGGHLERPSSHPRASPRLGDQRAPPLPGRHLAARRSPPILLRMCRFIYLHREEIKLGCGCPPYSAALDDPRTVSCSGEAAGCRFAVAWKKVHKAKRKQADVFVTKLEAARRQTDAAIRMIFLNEDALAIHTVAAAAYRILRDVKKLRGHSELADIFATTSRLYAAELAAGRRENLPEEIRGSPGWLDYLGRLSSDVDAGDEMEFEVTNEASYWRKFNVAANFLKHADADGEGLLHTNVVDNEDLLARTCSTYADITGHVTPEMLAFEYHLIANRPELDVSAQTPGDVSGLRRLSPSRQKRFYLAWIRRVKELGHGRFDLVDQKDVPGRK